MNQGNRFIVLSLNPCFDRIYFQSKTCKTKKTNQKSLNPCFDRIYFQCVNRHRKRGKYNRSQSLF